MAPGSRHQDTSPHPTDNLILSHPTEAEKVRTWETTHSQWGLALSLQGYVDRERHLTTVPLARDGGLTQWILARRPPVEDAVVAGSQETVNSSSQDIARGSSGRTPQETVFSGDEDAKDIPRPINGLTRGNKRVILSSCDTLKKKVLVKTRSSTIIRPTQGTGAISADDDNLSSKREGASCSIDGGDVDDGGRREAFRLVEGIAHGIGSVFTPPEHRSNGHAASMMIRLGDTLQGLHDEEECHAVCSVLYSDIGKRFYSRLGWKVFQSTHLAFPATSRDDTIAAAANVGAGAAAGAGGDVATALQGLSLLGQDQVAELAAQDEKMIRRKLSQATGKITVALLPDEETLLWFFHREDFMCRHLFSQTPSARGAVYTCSKDISPASANLPSSSSASGGTSPQPSRIWAWWHRAFYGGAEHPEKNTLYFLRFVVEDEDTISDDQLAEGIKQIVQFARAEAGRWLCGNVEIWNPAPRVKEAVLGRADLKEDLEGRFVDRQEDSIASLRWFGEGSVEDVDWIVNEKFGWC